MSSPLCPSALSGLLTQASQGLQHLPARHQPNSIPTPTGTPTPVGQPQAWESVEQATAGLGLLLPQTSPGPHQGISDPLHPQLQEPHQALGEDTG